MSKPYSHTLTLLALSVLLFAIPGCTPQIPKGALQLQPESLALRQLQTRKFDTHDEKSLLISGASLLQDMGFQIDESETKLGVLVGSKSTDAQDAGEIIGSVLIAALIGANIPWAEEQTIRASLVTYTIGEKQTALRVTFQRKVWNNRGEIHVNEGLKDPSLYQEFFEKLSKAVFLEAQQI